VGHRRTSAVALAQIEKRRIRERDGRKSEWLAAVYLMAKGYRILALRSKTGAGEIDLVAVRWKRLVFVEVKRRPSLGEAEASLTSRQQRRIHNAALLWLARHARYQSHEIRFDAVFIVPGRWPIHVENCL
jgi:putative endonuclease